MFPELGSLIDRAQALLSKGVVLIGIFPVFLFLLIGLISGYATCSWMHFWVDSFFDLEGGARTTWALVFVGVTSMMGFIYWTLNSTLRSLLEGRLFPKQVQRWLARRFQSDLEALTTKVEEKASPLFDFRHANLDDPKKPRADTWKAKLREARKQGVAAGGTGQPSAALRKASSDLAAVMAQRETIPFARVNELFRLLEPELAVNSAELIREFDTLQRDFEELADYAMGTAVDEYLAALTKRRSAYPRDPAALRPTRFANILAIGSEYALARYSIDPELFWLHFQKLAAADKELGPLLEAAKSRLDFSVAMTVMFGAATLVWTPALFAFGSSPMLLAVIIPGLVLTVTFHHGALLNARLYGEIIRAVVDLLRFALLDALHVGPPKSSDEEQQTWQDLTLHEQLDSRTKLTYV